MAHRMTNGAEVVVAFDLADYRTSISRFRQAVGIGGGASSMGQVVVQMARAPGEVPAFRFNTQDVYMTAVRKGGQWQPIVRGNYAQMGIDDNYEIDAHQVQQACIFAPSPTGTNLAVAVLTIAESARSQVVYQVMQQILQSRRAAKWSEILPLLRVWGEFTTDHHKRKPKVYGALGVRDYFDDKGAEGAITALRARGFVIDA